MGKSNKMFDEIDKNIGIKIRALRIASGFSRMQIAQTIDVSHQQIAKYENGTNRIPPGRLKVMARLFNVKVDDLLEEVETYIKSTSPHQRLAMELSRVFFKIENPQQQVALVQLARTMQTLN